MYVHLYYVVVPLMKIYALKSTTNQGRRKGGALGARAPHKFPENGKKRPISRKNCENLAKVHLLIMRCTPLSKELASPLLPTAVRKVSSFMNTSEM